MSFEMNSFLSEYEIKKPDYDYVERNYIGMENISYSPARYEKYNGHWIKKDNRKGLFGKRCAKLMFTGDITCFEKQFEQAENGEDYDFSYEFDAVRPVFSQSDLTVGNLETMIVPYAPYRTEKYVSEQNFHCNAPLEFLDAVYKAGIDVVTNANNHDLDTGAVGIGETIDNIEKFGLIQTGTFKTEKKHYEIIEVNDIKIGIVAFATEHNNKRCNLTDKGAEFILNDYSAAKAEKLFHEMKKDGAEVVFVCIHWGKENKTVNNKSQRKIAGKLAEIGYDCIIGSHPHVLQPFSVIKTKEKNVPVFYSMGNFISHNIDNKKARSVIACVDVEKNKNGIQLKCSYVPVFTSKLYGEKKYVVLPIKHNTKNRKNYRNKNKISEIMGDEIKINKSLSFCDSIERKETEEPAEAAGTVVKDAEKDINSIDKFPATYTDGKYIYTLDEDSAVVKGIAPEVHTLSYTVPARVAEIPVTSVEKGAFEGNRLMKKINFRKYLLSIGERAFKDCISLEGFQMSSGTEKIMDEAFSGCTALSSAVIKENVKYIGDHAFYNCSSLRSVKIYSGVNNIADNAFEGCEKAVFYCKEGSYGYEYAVKHGFDVVNMEL